MNFPRCRRFVAGGPGWPDRRPGRRQLCRIDHLCNGHAATAVALYAIFTRNASFLGRSTLPGARVRTSTEREWKRAKCERGITTAVTCGGAFTANEYKLSHFRLQHGLRAGSSHAVTAVDGKSIENVTIACIVHSIIAK